MKMKFVRPFDHLSPSLIFPEESCVSLVNVLSREVASLEDDVSVRASFSS